MKNIKKTISCMLAMLMLLSSMTVFSLNASANVSAGQCGDNVTWSLSEDKVLTISGEGAMCDLSIPPWDSLSFTTLVIEEGVTNISYAAFSYSYYLKSAYIPKSIFEIDSYAFMKCPKFTELYYAGNMSDWKNIYLGNSLFHDIVNIHFADGTQAGVCGNNVFWSLNDDILTVSGKGRMYDNVIPWDGLKYTTLIIEEGVTNISYGAFGYSEYLERAYIPLSVTEIGSYAFMKCPQFTELYYAGNMSDWQNIYMGNSLFHDIVNIHFADSTQAGVCGNNVFWSLNDDILTISGRGRMYDNVIPWDGLKYTTLIIEEGVTNIPHGAFANSEYLKTAYIPLSVTEIGDCAFMKCPKLCELCYDGSLSDWENIEMGTSPFHDTVNIYYDGNRPQNICGDNVRWVLKDNGTLIISGKGKMYDYSTPALGNTPGWLKYRNNIKRVKINDGVTSIGASAFEYCYYITSVTIPDSVTTIGTRAFFYCNSLTSLTIPSGVEKIDDCAFATCNSLTSVSMPESLTYIGEAAFSECLRLKSIVIPESVSFIGDGAFRACTELTSVNIPEGITSISRSAFTNCRSLETVKIPGTVTSIEGSVFYDCKSLKSIYMPKSLIYIGSSAFTNCSALSDVYYTGSENMWSNTDISDNNTDLINAKIHCSLSVGDINEDGKINAKDSNLIKRIIMGSFADDEAIRAADLNCDGNVNTKDLYMMKKLMIK